MNILLTSAGRRTYLIKYFKQAQCGKGLVHAANSILTYTLLQADKYVLTPNIYDAGYIDFILNYCKENNIGAIISLFDIDLPILAKNNQLFCENGIKLVVSDYHVTEICNDKWLTYKFLSKIGIKQTPTFINISEAKLAIAKGAMTYPLYIKPRWGMASIGIYKVCNENELNVLYKKLCTEIFNTYLKYESEIDKNHCVIIQQAISGQEYGIEVVNDLNGNYVTTMAKKKVAMRSGETDIAEIVASSQFEEVGQIIAENLKHIANLDVDCFVAHNGELYVLEMNCRFGGQYPFSHIAGANMPKQILNWLEGRQTDIALLSPRIGVLGCKELEPVIIK
jgi:carbamoyl-phosphate synthase large subunit